MPATRLQHSACLVDIPQQNKSILVLLFWRRTSAITAKKLSPVPNPVSAIIIWPSSDSLCANQSSNENMSRFLKAILNRKIDVRKPRRTQNTSVRSHLQAAIEEVEAETSYSNNFKLILNYISLFFLRRKPENLIKAQFTDFIKLSLTNDIKDEKFSNG